jgi:hypothetical protein
VCSVLLAKGRQTLQELLHGCAPLPALAVRQALLALLQQNLAACYLVPEEEGLSGVLRRAYFLYAPNTERMLQALRAPRFVQHARDRFGDAGEEAEALVEALLVNGRLRRAPPPRRPRRGAIPPPAVALPHAVVGSAAAAHSTAAAAPARRPAAAIAPSNL